MRTWNILWVFSTCLAVSFVWSMSFWINWINLTVSPMTYKHIAPVTARPRVRSNQSIWTVVPRGGFGNFMSQYATLYALAKLNGQQAFIPPTMHDKLARVFKVRLPIILEEVASHISWKFLKVLDWMTPDYGNIFDQYVKFSLTTGSWTYYHHIRKEILQEFSFHDFVVKGVNDYLAQIKGGRNNVTYVGVHVLRGQEGLVDDSKYIQKAMEYFRKKYAKPLFVVTSNGMNWCNENINSSLGDVYFAGDGNENFPGHDFALLAHCNHTIMTEGMFGIWAAYLAGGEAMYLKKVTLTDSPFKHEDVYLPEWIGVPADLSTLVSNKML